MFLKYHREDVQTIYNGIKKIEEVIEYIEDNLTTDINCDSLASMMNLSVYEFRRIFSFMVGRPISDYIRKRRLSMAALEIIANKDADLSEISEKYGYSNQSAFTRAFSEHHGFSPSLCNKADNKINIYMKPVFEVSMRGGESIPFDIIKSDTFFINGLSGVSEITDSCCCEAVWNSFYEDGYDKKIEKDLIYVSYESMNENVRCTIGEKKEEISDSDNAVKIPSALWASFTADTTDDDIINEKYAKILYEWLPSANLKRDESIPVIEIFPADMSEENFEWKILIPIKNI